MTQLLSSISGRLTASLSLGTLLPVTLFVVIGRLVVVPRLPSAAYSGFLQPLAALEAESWEIAAATMAIIVIGSSLFVLNIPHIALYEGYPWRSTRFGRYRRRRYLTELKALEAQVATLPALGQELRRLRQQGGAKATIAQIDHALTEVQEAREEAARQIFYRFPLSGAILPTRLGNVLRSAESYPMRQYGMAGVTLWPRLVAVIDSGYSSALDGAKAGLDFMINTATLSALLAFASLGAGLAAPLPTTAADWIRWLVEIIALVGVAGLAYGYSVGRAAAWGNLVRGAFDLYRGKLLTQLGYSQSPRDSSEERKLWRNISQRLIYGDPPRGKGQLLPYAPPQAPKTEADDTLGTRLEILKGLHPSKGGFTVNLEVRNRDKQQTAKGIRIVDTVPAGFEMEIGSEAVSSGHVVASGFNPYIFEVSTPLAATQACRISYRILRRQSLRRRFPFFLTL